MPKFTAKLRRRQLDESLKNIKEPVSLPRGYIREIRDALEMSSYELAERIGISQSSAMEMEEHERKGTITLKTLERAAAALGCKFVYGFVPETSLEQIVNEQARTRAKALSQTIFRTMALEQQSTGDNEHQVLIDELAIEVLRKGKRELWKRDK